MSDRDKGLLLGMNVLGERIVRLYCIEHLRQNFLRRHGQTNEMYFWKTANAVSEADYFTAINHLQQEQGFAAQCLLSIDRKMWVTAFIPGGAARRFGQKTSNAVEEMNSVLEKQENYQYSSFFKKFGTT